jgi:mono/diheme cytochrome c family protein
LIRALVVLISLISAGCATTGGADEESEPTLIDSAPDPVAETDAPIAAEESKQQEGEVPLAVAETEQPDDVAEGPDGALYVSDDYAGAIYRVSARGAGAAATTARAKLAAQRDPLAALAGDERARRIARGRALYESLACAACHEAERAQPGVVPRPLADLARRHTLAGLTRFLAAPTPPMPAVELGEEDRGALAAFLLDRHG